MTLFGVRMIFFTSARSGFLVAREVFEEQLKLHGVVVVEIGVGRERRIPRTVEDRLELGEESFQAGWQVSVSLEL